VSTELVIIPDLNSKTQNMSTGTEIDEEIANFRAVQEQLQRVRTDLQLVMSQLTENEMVKQELDLLDSSTNIYKMVGPVLIKNSLDDANETVSKRLEFITGEKKRLEGKAKELETRGNAIAMKVQQMQAQLQQATAAAVQEIQKAAAATAN
jgi:prefoldin beta subunit